MFGYRLLTTAATAAAVVAAALPAFSQTPRTPPPSPIEARKNRSGADPMAGYLKSRYRLSDADARERLALEQTIAETSARLARDNPNEFGGMWVEHEPVYKIVVAFADNKDRSALRETIEPRLRRYVQIKQVKRSTRQNDQAVDRIADALRSAGVDFTAGYDPASDAITVTVGSEGQVQRASSAIPPELRTEVRVVVGPLPAAAQTIVGPSSNQELYAGWDAAKNAADPNAGYCSLGFVVRNSYGRDSILTAGHCSSTLYVFQGGDQWLRLPAPYIDKNDIVNNKTYDYAGHEIQPIVTGPFIWFQNGRVKINGYEHVNNTVPGVVSSSYIDVMGTTGESGHFVGKVVCKSGATTGLTCGQITVNNNTSTKYSKLIRIGKSSQDIIAFGGDSGGAVYSSYQGETYRGYAVGLLVAAEVYDNGTRPCVNGNGVDCGAYYMPVDRINDREPAQLYTVSGLIQP